jgi:hypothetical protein
MAQAILRKKDYPLNYPAEIIDIIESMSFTKGKDVTIVGSMSLKSQQYAGDYDMIETVNTNYKSNTTAIQELVKDFQHIISNLLEKKNVYVGDIKAGIIPEWEVIPERARIENGRVVDFEPAKVESKVLELQKLGVLSKSEGDAIFKILNRKKYTPPSPEDFLALKKEVKPHLIHWTPKDILSGYVTLPTGRHYSLQEAFSSPTIVKLDVIAFVEQSRYTDFSIIYLLKNRGRALNAVDMSNDIESIKQDLEAYYILGNYFKALKRMFSLARKYNDTTVIEKLNTILNGDLGRLYSIISDIGTLQYLLENESHLSIERIRYELDGFRKRLGNVYTVKTPDKVLEELLRIEDLPRTELGRSTLEKVLSDIEEQLETLLSKGAEKIGKEVGLFPIPNKYRA